MPQTLNRTIPPSIHDAVEFDYNLPPLHRQQLDNGLPLYWLSAGVAEVAEVDFVFPAGLWQEPRPGVAQAAAALIKQGTRQRTAQQLHEAIEFYGATLRSSASDDFATLTLYCLSRHLPLLLPIVYEMLTEAVFPEEEVRLYKQNTIQRLMVSLRKCEFVANQKIDAALFGEAHPYGRFSTIEKTEAITREDITAFYKSAYNLGNVQIFMAGNLGATEVQYVNEVFGKEPVVLQPADQQVFAAPPPYEQKQFLINDPNGVQGAIRIGRLFPNRHHPDFPKMVVLNTLFGGYFGSRLMRNIREEKGFTYGIYSSIHPMVHGGSLTIHTEVGRHVIAPAVAEIYKEMEILCTEPAPEEELLLVKNYLLGGLLGDLDGPFHLLQRWRTLILNGLDEAHFNRNVAIYKSIGADELLALAQQYFGAEDFYEIVVV